MLEWLLPKVLSDALEKLNYNKLSEIRLRVGQAVMVDYIDKYYLSPIGITEQFNQAIICEREHIDEIISNATEKSLYAYNEELKQGFITATGGIRIGVCGECVYDDKTIKTVKSISSLNIRIPHEVKNCSLKIFPFVSEPNLQNTLILSPPGAGKTTILRDLAMQISDRFFKNILIIDERNEIANCLNGVPQHNVGHFTDVISNSTKHFGLENGIRSMKPDVVFTDEIANAGDIDAIAYALGCGVKVVATTHCANIEELKTKPNFQNLITGKFFERYIVLSTRNGAGTLEAIFSKDFSCIYA